MTARKSIQTARLLIDENDADTRQEKYSDILRHIRGVCRYLSQSYFRKRLNPN